MTEKAKIEVNKTEFKLLQWYWKYREMVKPGSLVFHFDSQGGLRKKEVHAYGSSEGVDRVS